MVNIGSIIEDLIKKTWFYSGLFVIASYLITIIISRTKGEIKNIKFLVFIVLALLIISRDCIVYLYVNEKEKSDKPYVDQGLLFENRVTSLSYLNERYGEGDYVEILSRKENGVKNKGVIVLIDKNQNIELIDDDSKKRTKINLNQDKIIKLIDNRSSPSYMWDGIVTMLLSSGNVGNLNTERNTNNINSTSSRQKLNEKTTQKENAISLENIEPVKPIQNKSTSTSNVDWADE